MITVDYNWKEFNINGNLALNNIKALSDKIVGTSHNSKFQVHFSEQPSQEELEAINEYWDSLDEESEEAISYQSADEINQAIADEKQLLIDSAKVKLLALGLSEAEIAAMLGA